MLTIFFFSLLTTLLQHSEDVYIYKALAFNLFHSRRDISTIPYIPTKYARNRADEKVIFVPEREKFLLLPTSQKPCPYSYQMSSLLAKLLLAGLWLSFAFASSEIPITSGLKRGDTAPKKPNAGSGSNSSSIPTSAPATANPFRKLKHDLKKRDSLDCCDCSFEGDGLAVLDGEEDIDYGDDDPYTINSWITHPFNTMGCGGHSYTAFNVYGTGYGRWDYDHYDIQFYLDNQYDEPGGLYVLQWGEPQVDTSLDFSAFSDNTELFTAYVIRATDYTVLDTCACYSRSSASTWHCVEEFACCLGGQCSEELNFQCGPCFTLGG